MWPGILLGSVGCYVLKLVGVSVPGRVLADRRVQAVAAALPIGLLAALCVTQTFTSGHHLVIDARVGGLAAGLTVVALRAPFLVTVAVAVATTALIRLLA
jgi:Branched-chain amino acid transport protein (AzlD)